ncbi:transposase [Patescibacteria group bacterium]|nr:transposase [Patescibacteria group bacterium]
MANKRRTFTPEQKVRILKEHLIDRKPVSDICDAFGLQPVQFYQWQKQFFEQGHSAFARTDKDTSHKTISKLEQKLSQKNEVLAELMGEHVALKKKLGEI